MRILFCLILLAGITAGCRTMALKNTDGEMIWTQSSESEWIRNGEPIEFEGKAWHPQDGIESLQDSEVLLMGTYRDVRFFIDKLDVRPYDRLYTKFDTNKFRYFELKRQSD